MKKNSTASKPAAKSTARTKDLRPKADPKAGGIIVQGRTGGNTNHNETLMADTPAPTTISTKDLEPKADPKGGWIVMNHNETVASDTAEPAKDLTPKADPKAGSIIMPDLKPKADPKAGGVIVQGRTGGNTNSSLIQKFEGGEVEGESTTLP